METPCTNLDGYPSVRNGERPGKSAGYNGFFTDGHWWLFCFLILALKFLLLTFDPLPKLFMGDSGSYLCRQCPVGGLRIGHFYTGMLFAGHPFGQKVSLHLLILQAFLGANTAILIMTYLPIDFWT